MGKYNSGLYYKICLYSGSSEWIDGSQQGGKGELLIAICINKAIKQIDVAIDRSVENSTMTLIVDDKINEGLKKLGVDPQDKIDYKVFYQSAQGTRLLPTFKRIHKKEFIFSKIIGNLFKNRAN